MNYTYDSQNHMTSATGNGNTIKMVYDRGPRRQVFVAGVGDAFGNSCSGQSPARHPAFRDRPE
jgi:hypothetical protein